MCAPLQQENSVTALVTFMVIATVYWPLKQVTLALMLYVRSDKRSDVRLGMRSQQKSIG